MASRARRSWNSGPSGWRDLAPFSACCNKRPSETGSDKRWRRTGRPMPMLMSSATSLLPSLSGGGNPCSGARTSLCVWRSLCEQLGQRWRVLRPNSRFETTPCGVLLTRPSSRTIGGGSVMPSTCSTNQWSACGGGAQGVRATARCASQVIFARVSVVSPQVFGMSPGWPCPPFKCRQRWPGSQQIGFPSEALGSRLLRGRSPTAAGLAVGHARGLPCG